MGRFRRAGPNRLYGSPDQVSLVAMGDNGITRTDEDELCAIHLRNRLEGRPGDADAMRAGVGIDEVTGATSDDILTPKPLPQDDQSTLSWRTLPT
jgi:hypothetical protein